jgi:hypothetical protein
MCKEAASATVNGERFSLKEAVSGSDAGEDFFSLEACEYAVHSLPHRSVEKGGM